MAGRKPTSEVDRFWEKVSIRGDDECWPWVAGTHKGYGTFRETGAGRGAKKPAPSVAYRLAFGPVPKGHEIDHTCCNPLCVNPRHLEAVTHSENMKRMWQRGRARPGPLPDSRSIAMGVDHPRAKLTREQIAAILADTRNPKVIALEYGLHWSAIYKLRAGLTYRRDGRRLIHVRGSFP
jgi:hypothetical protein